MLLALLATAQFRQATVQDIVRAEREFSALSAKIGRRKAFLANFAPDCIVFAPGPVNGIKRTTADPEGQGTLTWEPTRAEIANSGDMGYTTGPWEYRVGDKTVAGRYFSIWKLQPEGNWKVVVDAGSGNSDGKPETLELPTRNYRPRASSWPAVGEKETLFAADRMLGQAPHDINKWSWPDLYLLQSGSLPMRGQEAFRGVHSRVGETTIDGDVAGSGEFGYTYGSFETEGKKGNYVRVWRKNRADEWKVAVYVLLPVR